MTAKERDLRPGRAPVLKVAQWPERKGDRVIVRVSQLQVAEGQPRLRADLSAINYVAYLMDEAAAPGERKGHDGATPQLFTGPELEPPAYFIKQFMLSRARYRGVKLEHAWAENIISAELPGEERVVSTVLSFRPRDGKRIELEGFTRRFMAQVRADHYDAPFLWAGATHHNTENPHVHVIIRGLLGIEDGNDKSGMACKIHQAYWQRGMRSRAIALLEATLDERQAG